MHQFPRYSPSFYRSSSGAEIDLVLEKGNKRIAIEIKSSANPGLTQGFFEAQKIIRPDRSFIIAPVNSPYPYKQDVWVYNLKDIIKMDF